MFIQVERGEDGSQGAIAIYQNEDGDWLGLSPAEAYETYILLKGLVKERVLVVSVGDDD